jgi:hypothetical protein
MPANMPTQLTFALISEYDKINLVQTHIEEEEVQTHIEEEEEEFDFRTRCPQESWDQFLVRSIRKKD